jgi:uncharacterized protein YecT (DUF1311 family)
MRSSWGASPDRARLTVAILLCLANWPAGSSPLNDCYAGAETRLDVGPCLEAELQRAGAELAEAEEAERQKLLELAEVTGRDSASLAFEQAVNNFRAFREATCRWVRLEAEPGTGADDFELDCLVRMTYQWMAELRK